MMLNTNINQPEQLQTVMKQEMLWKVIFLLYFKWDFLLISQKNEATCSGNFQVGDSTDVRDCLFCDDTRYDIFFETSDGFILGDGLACDEDDRPVQLEEFQFYS